MQRPLTAVAMFVVKLPRLVLLMAKSMHSKIAFHHAPTWGAPVVYTLLLVTVRTRCNVCLVDTQVTKTNDLLK